MITGVVLSEGQDIDAEFEDPTESAPDVESSSESGSQSHESEESEERLSTGTRTKFEKGHTQNRGTVGKSWKDRKPPSELQALEALDEIKGLLRPEREGKSRGWYKGSTVKGWSGNILRKIQSFLCLFMGEKSATKGQWTKASEQAAQSLGQPSKNAPKTLRNYAKKFIATKKPPTNLYGTSTQACIDADEEFAQNVNLYLQSKGKYVKADDITVYLNKPDVQQQWDLKKSIGKATAKRWMVKLEYRWVKNHKGQYVDGHERKDVVDYRKNVYLPKWYEMEPRMRCWNNEGIQEPLNLPSGVAPIVPWFHDESIYYANDRRLSQWVYKDASPTPYAKGEGSSLMTALYFSPDYGFLRSPDRKEDARVIFKPGKTRDGYFDNEDILAQATVAMDICEKYFPDDQHIFIYDNATTHLKRANNALSACKMPKNTPKSGTNWGVEVIKLKPDGQIEHGSNGKPLKIKVKMGPGYFNGRSQDFYFPEDHERAGVF